MINKIYSNKSFQSALPWLMLILGLLCLTFGTFNESENKKLLDFLKELGKAILIGGVFAVLLKSIQFMGVFKEALISIVYEAKFLENRKDLPTIWEKVSIVLFKNKFPKISEKVLNDVKETYFPTQEVIYYENAEHELKFNLIDDSNVLKIILITNLDVVCENKVTKTYYEHGFSKDCKSYKLIKFKIDGNDVNKPEVFDKNINGQIYQITKAKLTGKDKYRITLHVERTINLDEDNLYKFSATKIFNKLKVQIHFDSNLSFDFQGLGTLKDFTNNKNHEHFREFVYDGLIYKKQGYLIRIKRV